MSGTSVDQASRLITACRKKQIKQWDTLGKLALFKLIKNRFTVDILSMEKSRHAHNALNSKLGELELLVLENLWTAPGADAKSLLASLSPGRKISLSTVQSTLERLVRKGYLERDKVGHSFRYFPLRSRGELMGTMLREVIQLLHDGRANTILSSFVNVAEGLDENALDQLEALIQKKRRERMDD